LRKQSPAFCSGFGCKKNKTELFVAKSRDRLILLKKKDLFVAKSRDSLILLQKAGIVFFVAKKKFYFVAKTLSYNSLFFLLQQITHLHIAIFGLKTKTLTFLGKSISFCLRYI
jgi:hypothetical protein